MSARQSASFSATSSRPMRIASRRWETGRPSGNHSA